MKVELFYLHKNQTVDNAWYALKDALEAEQLNPTITLWTISSQALAVHWKFPGSISLRVDDEDWWPLDDAESLGYPLRTRTYLTPVGNRRFPTAAMLQEGFHALRTAAIAFIKARADLYNRFVFINSQNDSYAIRMNDGQFTLENFSPREGALYSEKELSFEQTLSYLRKYGFSFMYGQSE